MMLITAVVPPSRVDRLTETLALFGVRGLTVSHTFAPARPGAVVEIYRGNRWSKSFVPWVRLEILAPDVDTPDLVRVISRAVEPVAVSDVLVWATRVDYLVRIRTGELGLDAL
ncbi:MAG: P-II family nitrogen regulator [Micromonosporaceae bacterium]|nr:P-II family nitrogen regulator [Micromonosporaceae bacterium]